MAAAGASAGAAAVAAASASSCGSFRMLATCGRARVGVWRGLQTPTLLRHTIGGTAPYLTPDEAGGDGHGTSVRFSHMFEQAAAVKASGRRLGDYLNLGAGPTILTIRDTGTFSEGYNGAKFVTVATASGRRKVTVKDYVTATNSLRPDVAVAMAHEVVSSDKHKRQSTSVARSATWLKGMLEGTKHSDVDVFGVVTGGTVPGLRAEAARSIAAQEGVRGVVLGGLGCGESPAERAAALDEMVGALPSDLPRMLVGVDGPWELLKAVEAGVDIFDSAYAHKLAELGYACTFPIDVLESQPAAPSGKYEDEDGDVAMGTDSETAGLAGSPPCCPGDSTKICLLDQRFTLDTAPLVAGCTCFACRKHTRAYIRHLLDAHEMLGPVLLYAHNLFHMERLAARARDAVTDGRFAEYKAAYAAATGIAKASTPVAEPVHDPTTA